MNNNSNNEQNNIINVDFDSDNENNDYENNDYETVSDNDNDNDDDDDHNNNHYNNHYSYDENMVCEFSDEYNNLNDAINNAINNNINNDENNNEIDNNLDNAMNEFDINTNVFESILLIRETFVYNNENINERITIRYIYEQLANTYTDITLVDLLNHIRYYYNINLPEYNNDIDIFFSYVYNQAVVTDNNAIGLVGVDQNNVEVPNTFMNVQIYYNQINDNGTDNLSNTLNGAFANVINTALNNIVIDISNNVNIGPLGSGSDLMMNIINNHNQNQNQNNNQNNNLFNIFNVFNSLTNPPLQTITEESINNLECIPFNEINKDVKEMNSEHCTICQENYNDDDNILILGCNHVFHPECIRPWLSTCSNLCPICRYKCQNTTPDELD